MPVYEFQYLDCKSKFPLTLTFKEHSEKNYKCPKCESKNLEKQLSRINVVTSKKS